MHMIFVFHKDHIFGTPIRELALEGMTVRDIVTCMNQPERFWTDGVVTIGDQVVPAEMWSRVRPKVGSAVALHLAPQGANILKTIALIGIIAGAALISGGALAPLFGTALGLPGPLGLLAAGSIGASASAIAFSVGATLVLNALSPPPSSSSISPANANGPNNASLDGNIIQPGAILPHVRGTRKIFPPFVVKPLVEIVGDDEIVTAVYGLGGPHALSDLRVSGTPIASIDGLTYETKEGHASDTAITLVNRQSRTNNSGFKLSKHVVGLDTAAVGAVGLTLVTSGTTPADSCPHWESTSALGSPDEIWLTLRYDALCDGANPSTYQINPIRVRMRLVGTTTWVYMPEVIFRSHRAAALTRDIRIKWGTAPAQPTASDADAPYAVLTVAPMYAPVTIGNIGSLTNIFNGDFTSIASSGGVTSIYAGLQVLTNALRAIRYAVVVPSAGSGFIVGGTGNITINLRGKAVGAPASATDGTLLATTGSIADTTSPITLTSSDTTTQYESLFIEMTTGSAATLQVAELMLIDAEGDFSILAHSDFRTAFTTRHYDTSNAGANSVANVALYSDRVEFFINAANNPKGDYELQIIRGTTISASNFVPSRYTHTSTNFFTDMFRAIRAIHGFITCWDVPDNVSQHADDVGVLRVARIWNEAPLTNAPGNMALIAVKSTNKQLGEVSCLASRYVYDYDSILGTWTTLTTTNNPAPHVRDVLTGSLNADPVPDDLLGDDSFVTFRTRCANYGRQVNAIFDNQSADVVAQVCASSGYARLRQSELFEIIQDRDRSADSPVQTFTARNSRGYTWERDFPRLPSGFRCVYYDSTNNYQETELIVLDPDGDSGSRYEEMRYDGYVTASEVQERALFDLAQTRARAVRHSFDTNQQAIKCKRGDLVAINHPVLTSQMGAGYVRSISLSGSDVLSLTLDGTVPGNGSDRLGAQIRLETGEEIVAEITAAGTESTTITFVSPLLGPVDGLVVGCLVTTGLLGSERMRLVVGEIVPKEGSQFPCTIMALDEAPELFGAPTARNIIRQIGLDEDLVLCLDAGDGDSFVSGQVWYDTSGQGNNFWFGTDAA